MKLKISFVIFLLLFYSSTSLILAQHFTSPSYNIDWGNFNMTSGRKSSANYQLTDTVGQNAPGQSDKNGIFVQSGFQYIYNTFTELSFSIDKLNINFGTLTPGVASTAVNVLTVTTPSGHGYQIMASENHPLWINSSNYIPDTSCDLSDCTFNSSTPWTQNSIYGFGFNVAGIGATAYFPDSTYFRPFSDISNNESPTIISSENIPVKNQTATVSYKAIISPLQGAGDYENYITYILIPKY